ncbi:TPR repeat and CHAT domain containing protein [Psychroflexus torquis ATCC 700755]|uniref:TPR repeat and CHAT domain containing protein n=1 Tax=Psychroflexus torquis (strain ATCC 700755 / CIP 106069 / ACAM 623) TaxID=313595 RepID=K4IGI3_PSYTT|nr:CHAT domain-containing protein [Psychroflexus torquis]AFU68176.1 TPR repeat and CHAT domain containing protein [Psychroflexus torquis ATCC 700755]
MKKKINLSFLIIFLFFQSNTFAQTDKGNNDWNESLNTGIQALNTKSFNSAESELKKAYRIAISVFDENSENLTTTAYYYAITLMQLDKNIEAQEPMEMALTGFKFLHGETSEQYATGLSILANIYLRNKVYKLAEEKYLESNEVLKNMYGENHYMYGIALTNFAAYYRKIENYKKALETLNEGFAILKDNPEFDQQYYNNLRYNNLSEIYQGLGKLEEALAIEEESLNYIKINYGKFTTNYANILTSIGGINIDLGYFNKAEKHLEEAAFIFEQLENLENEEALGNTYLFMVACYVETSDYKKALYYASEGIRLTKLESNTPPLNALNYYGILGRLSWELGDFTQTKEYFQKIIDGTIKSIGINAPQLPVLKSNLGMCYRELEETDKAIQLTQEAFNMAKEMEYSIKDKEYRTCLNNLSILLLDQKKYEEVIKNLKTILDEEDKSYPNYWLKAVDLAGVYMMNNQCNEALKLLEKAIGKVKQFYGKEDPNYIATLNSLIIAQRCEKKYQNLINNIEEANQLTKNQLLKRFSFSPENLQRFFLADLEYSFNLYETIGLDFKNDKLAIINLENQFLLKGLLLNQSKNITEKLADLNDEVINLQIDEYINNKQLLNRLEVEKNLNNEEVLNDLKAKISRSEVELVQLYNKKFKKTIDFNKSWKKVQKKLKDNEVAIEFSRFNNISYQSLDSTFYMAYIIKKGVDKPEVIKLFEEDQLLKIVTYAGGLNQLNLSRGSKASNVGDKIKTNSLYNLIWKPLEQYLTNIETVYYAPSGLLHNISFAALNTDNRFLINKYNLYQLSSTFELAQGFEQPTPDNILLIGGIEYDYLKKETQKKIVKNESKPLDLLAINSERGKGNKWSYLPGTLNEINNLKKLLIDKNKNSEILKGDAATESRFKSLSNNSPNIIHIATHGFFFENKSKSKDFLSFSDENRKFKANENPLKRTGLLLSGANYAWINGDNPFEIDNGVLTAEEISTLDLSNTKMVVLSACETGLGDIDASEGVYGLQRAFKMAGVDIIIMSLWEVPDEETAEFMNLFYSNWLGGIDVRIAFNQTQRSMSNKYKDHPEKWAAFVLFE